jgi:hypothetical protein
MSSVSRRPRQSTVLAQRIGAMEVSSMTSSIRPFQALALGFVRVPAAVTAR